jgi:glycosyltransferase involved in cell wall biosynthesis
MEHRLRFCMITTFYPPYSFGGDGVFVHGLANELGRRGHLVEVIHCTDAFRLLTQREPESIYQDHPNVMVHGLKSAFGRLSPLATQQTGLPVFKSRQIREILEKGFDVIHYHNISLIGGPKILEYGKAIKLYTMHEYWLVCPTHVLFKFNREVCIRPHCFTCGLTYRRPPQLWRHSGMMNSAVKHIDAFIAPSRFSKEVHKRMGLAVPIEYLPHFVPDTRNETRMPAAANGSPPERKPYFLFVGRLEKIKGLQAIIPVFRRYKKAELWIAGSGTYERHLRHLAKGLGNIRFLGHRTKAELQTLYRDAVALVVPSLSYEVFALVILEAFLQRTPAIVRNIGGMPEIIQESGGGFVYNTEPELIHAMEKLLSDSSCRNYLGESGLRTLGEKWTVDAHLKSYFGLIRRIAITRDAAMTFTHPQSRSGNSSVSEI